MPVREKFIRKHSRATHHVAVRAAAVRGAHQAFPHLTSGELACALGIGRHQVRHYLLGDLKSTQNRMPAWAPTFLAACSSLATSQPARAAEAFERLARELYAATHP